MDTMRVFIKQQKLQIMTQKYFGSEQKEESNGETVLAKCSNYLVPGKDSHRVIAKDAEMQATSFCSVLLQYLTQQEPGQWSVPNSHDRLW